LIAYHEPPKKNAKKTGDEDDSMGGSEGKSSKLNNGWILRDYFFKKDWWLGLVDDFRTFRMEGASLNLNEFIAA